jgi:PAS domain S-box-containing protein
MPLSSDVLRMVESALDAAAVVDENLEVLAFNRPLADMVGLRVREMQRERPRAICHERLGLETCKRECLAHRAFRTGKAVREHQISGNNGRVVVVAEVPLQVASGERRVVLETFRDVTAETRMQQRFKGLLQLERDQNERLQEEVAKRTAELTHTRNHLIQMEKMSSLGLLVAGVAHEINNPINFIHGNIEFVEQHCRSLLGLIELLGDSFGEREPFERMCSQADLPYIRQDLPKLMNAFRTGTDRVMHIVGDLRTFSHMGNRKTAGRVDVVPGFVTTLNLVSGEARKRRVTLHRDLGDLPLVEGNASQLNQVLMNLVVNAIQAAPEDGNVWVSAHVQPEGHILVQVEDDGQGLTAELQTRIFDPFFTTKPEGQGTGLGLSISLSIVRTHGGEMRAVNSPRGGAMFQVFLPVVKMGDRTAPAVTLPLSGG